MLEAYFYANQTILFSYWDFRLSSGTGTGTVTKKQAPKILGKVGMKSKSSLLDARSKIIQKRRVTIRDAREKIAENTRKSIKDARELISKKKPNHPPRSLKALAISRGKPIRARKPSFDSDELMNDSDFTQLRRTVRNEIYRSAPPITMPKLPSFNINQDLARMSPDPFDCYVVPTRRPVLIPPIRTERLDRTMRPGRPMNAHMDAYVQRKPILRPTPLDDHDDRFSDDRYISVSKEGVRSRLYNESGRDRNESAGIFAKLPVQGTSLPSAAQIGHRIIGKFNLSKLHDKTFSYSHFICSLEFT